MTRVLTGITGFIALGYVAGLVVGAATIADMAASPRSAWRNTGRRRRNSEAMVVASWFILGWGAVLAGIFWFAGNARTQVRISYFDRQDSEQQDFDQLDLGAAELEETPTLKAPQLARRMEFVQTAADPKEPNVATRIDLVEEPKMTAPSSESVAEIDISEAYSTE